jgi:translation initiation factor 2 beta subunit (eIF-2beta)/eIF-5
MNIDLNKLMLSNEKGNALGRKFEITEKLEMDKEYTILIKGQVFSESYTTNNDGSVNALYKICPSCLEVITDNIKKEL